MGRNSDSRIFLGGGVEGHSVRTHREKKRKSRFRGMAIVVETSRDFTDDGRDRRSRNTLCGADDGKRRISRFAVTGGKKSITLLFMIFLVKTIFFNRWLLLSPPSISYRCRAREIRKFKKTKTEDETATGIDRPCADDNAHGLRARNASTTDKETTQIKTRKTRLG